MKEIDQERTERKAEKGRNDRQKQEKEIGKK
jgi:hypothetical protein